MEQGYIWVYPKNRVSDIEHANIFYGTQKEFVTWITKGPASGKTQDEILSNSACFSKTTINFKESTMSTNNTEKNLKEELAFRKLIREKATPLVEAAFAKKQQELVLQEKINLIAEVVTELVMEAKAPKKQKVEKQSMMKKAVNTTNPWKGKNAHKVDTKWVKGKAKKEGQAKHQMKHTTNKKAEKTMDYDNAFEGSAAKFYTKKKNSKK